MGPKHQTCKVQPPEHKTGVQSVLGPSWGWPEMWVLKGGAVTSHQAGSSLKWELLEA